MSNIKKRKQKKAGKQNGVKTGKIGISEFYEGYGITTEYRYHFQNQIYQ